MLWKPILVAVVAPLVGVDAARAGAEEPPSPVAETLGDMNSDGVPDGWQLHPGGNGKATSTAFVAAGGGEGEMRLVDKDPQQGVGFRTFAKPPRRLLCAC